MVVSEQERVTSSGSCSDTGPEYSSLGRLNSLSLQSALQVSRQVPSGALQPDKIALSTLSKIEPADEPLATFEVVGRSELGPASSLQL